MSPEPAKIEFISADQVPKKTEQKEPVHDVKNLGKQIEKEFQNDQEKAIFTREFNKIIKERFNQFSSDFQKTFVDSSGQPDTKKLLELYGINHESNEQKNKEVSGSNIPERPANAPTGSQFMNAMDKLGNMNLKENQHKMEEYIMAEIARGNIPSFCRPEKMKSITMTNKDGTKVSFKAGLDYLAIGSDNDHIRVPMTPLLAQALSKKYGWGLPTAEMTNAIYATSDLKVEPGGLVQTNDDQYHMQGNDFIRRHNQKIADQLGSSGMDRLRRGEALVAGHKKDVIISDYALKNPGRLDFRGLYSNGKPIQTNPAHEDDYRDYSHGFRPIDGNVTIVSADGQTKTMSYYEALKNPQIAKVLNGAEGALDASQIYSRKKFNSTS